jgi:hypothetical protein
MRSKSANSPFSSKFLIRDKFVKSIFIRISRVFGHLIDLYGVNRYLNALSSLFIEMMADFTNLSRIRNLLLNGLFALFDRMKIKDFQKLHMSLNPHSRILLGELEELHKNDFRYFGKV